MLLLSAVPAKDEDISSSAFVKTDVRWTDASERGSPGVMDAISINRPDLDNARAGRRSNSNQSRATRRNEIDLSRCDALAEDLLESMMLLFSNTSQVPRSYKIKTFYLPLSVSPSILSKCHILECYGQPA
jgi:hypothetical protein